ncbi:SDR family oxidoreductase [Dactylosporangium sp. NPDC050688]|uniref:SDR family NAD(P)-dependent oxidoreductase n=1 Tax=Dactylosporangium sp. NPDC050688 TaxID=3157217 RepID=UPI0033EE5412
MTGAASGLGRAMSYALARAGARLIAVDIDATALRETERHRPAGTELVIEQTDLTDEAAVEDLAERLNARFGEIHVVFANAGIVLVKPSIELTNADMARVFDINVLGTFATARSFGRRMLAGRGGKLILTTSQAGNHGSARWTAYCASKAAVTSMTESLAAEWGPTVTVNAIAPGAVRTRINQHVLDDPEYLAALAGSTAVGRLAVPEDLGPLAVFLAGPGSDMMSGTVVSIDGGKK